MNCYKLTGDSKISDMNHVRIFLCIYTHEHIRLWSLSSLVLGKGRRNQNKGHEIKRVMK